MGPLAEELRRYFSAAAEACGPNAAHAFPPHVSVTGFFHDRAPDWQAYGDALAAAAQQIGRPPTPEATVTTLFLHDHHHGLAVESPWLCALAAEFAARAPAATRMDAVRPKRDLHISLAYGFDALFGPRLADLARRLVDPAVGAEWELRLYERASGNRWLLHGSWKCGSGATHLIPLGVCVDE